MGTKERAGMEELVALARRLVDDLGVLGAETPGDQGFALRLAQAHAWGLLDQLDEIVAGGAAEPDAQVPHAPILAGPSPALHPY